MESISDQEKHYIIVQLILTGISPIVVREIFDREFHPVRLKSSLSNYKVWNKIQQLKHKGVMNQSQMNLLYPKGGIEPSSSTFDITLMLCLLRNFTNVNVYDQTPKPHDTSLAADLGPKTSWGSQVYAKCQKVRQAIENSDQRIFYEIFNEMHSSMKERENLKEEFEKLKEENKLKIDFLRVEQQEEAELGNLYRSKEDFQQNIEIKRQWRKI
ncbi:unnamed protein product [Mytilus edulis]|uniref:DZIP3-like HEPN domain-containing protein n=1 Tax=Mytilus edulis TaxID=6550 RepID=A0A8S3PW69_MYTED|nr:unnamed protein product [Mytilus edulis]